jgi:hypothetical protein
MSADMLKSSSLHYSYVLPNLRTTNTSGIT